jgi:CRISPR-associated protein Cas8a1/Csx13
LEELSIGLFDPGMTHLHRVGLAGLFMTLSALEKRSDVDWALASRSVRMSWDCPTEELFTWLLSNAFGFRKDGLVDFAAHRSLRLSDLNRVHLHKALLDSFLQHNKQNKIPKGATRRLVLDLDGKPVFLEYRPMLTSYAHADAAKILVNSRGRLRAGITVKGWLFLGAAQRHTAWQATEVKEPPSRALCLLFAPAAALYYRLYHRGLVGRRDRRLDVAVVLPHLTDLSSYARSYERYLRSPVDRLHADGLSDAALNALLTLKAGSALGELGVTGCTVITMGTAPWSSQQRTRTGVLDLEDVSAERVDSFEYAIRSLPNRVVIKQDRPTAARPFPESHFFVAASSVRGLVAENIVHGRDWFAGFTSLMRSKEQAKAVFYERGGLRKMVEEYREQGKIERHFIEAVHDAVRNRYGALAARAKQLGENIRFDREFERMRTGLLRAKNRATLRAEIADLLARGGLNQSLRKNWPDILPLVTGPDWQRARDLALLALASYTGRGAQEIEATRVEDSEVEEETA